MSKSFVSLLYEHSVAHHQMPVYEFFSESSKWKCLVSVLGEKVEGVAQTKKLAKQEAARLMLMTLNLHNDIQSSYILEDNVNSIAALREFCLANKLKPPSFELDEQGSSHAPVFVYKATVCGISFEEKASNKRQAKRMCASGLLLKLKSCFTVNDEIPLKDDNFMNDLVIDRLKLAGLEKHSCTAPDLQYRDITLLFRNNFYPKSTTLEALNNDISNTEETSVILQQIFKELKLDFVIKELPSNADKLTSLSVLSFPGWNFIGTGEEYNVSKRNAELRALNFIKTMSK